MSTSTTSKATTKLLDDAKALTAEKRAVALMDAYKKQAESSDASFKDQEAVITVLADTLVELKDVKRIRTVLLLVCKAKHAFAKAKMAKLVRLLVDKATLVPDSTKEQCDMVEEAIEWAREQKRAFLRQRLEARLAALLYECSEYGKALKIVQTLAYELKKLDDKLLLVEIQLLESRIHLSLRNVAKAKASLTAARTAANAIYCPPTLAGQMDLQSGVLHAEENDYKTAFSYFYEAFDTYHTIDRELASRALKYMLLCKIMMKRAQDVSTILSGKMALEYAGDEVNALKTVAETVKARSLSNFEAEQKAFPQSLKDDKVVMTHLNRLHSDLIEQNLQRILEPYSRVQLSFIASQIDLAEEVVEKKLSQMVLESSIHGILDQEKGEFIVFDEATDEGVYPKALSTLAEMSKVVDELHVGARQLG